jgi:hypothetical protein
LEKSEIISFILLTKIPLILTKILAVRYVPFGTPGKPWTTFPSKSSTAKLAYSEWEKIAIARRPPEMTSTSSTSRLRRSVRAAFKVASVVSAHPLDFWPRITPYREKIGKQN